MCIGPTNMYRDLFSLLTQVASYAITAASIFTVLGDEDLFHKVVKTELSPGAVAI